MGVRTGKTLFLLLATVMGRYLLTRSMEDVCPYKTFWMSGLSQCKFHDEQQKEERSTLLIQ
jgi:hypothetical protein